MNSISRDGFFKRYQHRITIECEAYLTNTRMAVSSCFLYFFTLEAFFDAIWIHYLSFDTLDTWQSQALYYFDASL